MIFAPFLKLILKEKILNGQLNSSLLIMDWIMDPHMQLNAQTALPLYSLICKAKPKHNKLSRIPHHHAFPLCRKGLARRHELM